MGFLSGLGTAFRRAGKTAGSIVSGATGQETQSAADQAGQFAKRAEAEGAGQMATGKTQQATAGSGYTQVGQQGQDIYNAAKTQGADYDAKVAASLGQTPEQYLAAQSAAAEEQAGKEAAGTTQQATKAAIKAGRTGGMMGGQAGLAAAQQAGSTYAGAKSTAASQAKSDYASKASQNLTGLQTQAGEMANRQVSGTNLQATGASGQAGLAGQSLNAGTSMYGTAGGGYGTKTSGAAAAGSQAGGMIGNLAGAGASIAGLFSDRNLKENIRPVSLSDALEKVKSYGFRYKGENRPEVGVMAQDLEGGPLESSVVETPVGKAIDTKRLTTANTAALSEHEKRLRQIEELISGLSDMKESV